MLKKDLCSQILIAANKIKIDICSNKNYITKIYEKLSGCKTSENNYLHTIGKQTDMMSREEFIKIFENKKMVFVLAVLDDGSATGRKIENIESFNSNIAKFSLLELSRSMRGRDADLEIAQIERES